MVLILGLTLSTRMSSQNLYKFFNLRVERVNIIWTLLEWSYLLKEILLISKRKLKKVKFFLIVFYLVFQQWTKKQFLFKSFLNKNWYHYSLISDCSRQKFNLKLCACQTKALTIASIAYKMGRDSLLEVLHRFNPKFKGIFIYANIFYIGYQSFFANYFYCTFFNRH